MRKAVKMNWDAEKYGKDFSFVYKYGEGVLKLMDIRPGMKVLDLGCGNGVLTGKMAEEGVEASGIDASPEQIEAAKKAYPKLSFRVGDATNFRLPERVDAVFSNAVFHWIARKDQPAMMRCVHKALNEGGQFVFEMGGYRNNAVIHSAMDRAFADHGLVYQVPFYFPTIGEYSGMLENAGFHVTYMNLFARPTVLSGENGMADWIRMFIRKPFEAVNIKESMKNSIIDEAVSLMKPLLYQDGVWTADYVRLRGKCLG
jgi:trans-aconitate methyltransferase